MRFRRVSNADSESRSAMRAALVHFVRKTISEDANDVHDEIELLD